MERSTNLVELATELTIAWLGNGNTRTPAEDVPTFLRAMHDALASLEAAPVAPDQAVPDHQPAVSVRESLASRDHLISMIDGKPYRTLRRHLSTHGLTPDEYRARYKLRRDYPMVAPNYSEARRAMAKKIGLGRKPGATRSKAPSAPAAAKTPRRRRGAAGNGDNAG